MAEVSFCSDAQERLAALLGKASDLVPYVSDSACDELFSQLAAFCREALAEKAACAESKFLHLDVEQLIALSKEDLKRERPLTSEGSVKRGRSGEGVTPSLCPASNPDGVTWSFEDAYNVVEVTLISGQPFKVHLLAKPPVAGNQRPSKFVMGEHAFDDISSLKGRNGAKLRKTLLAALSLYCAKESGFPPILVTKLGLSEWGVELANELKSK